MTKRRIRQEPKEPPKVEGGGMAYVGVSAHLDVPRRNLTAEEVKRFGREWLLSLRCANHGTPMYVLIEKKKQNAGEVDNGSRN